MRAKVLLDYLFFENNEKRRLDLDPINDFAKK